MMFRVAGRASAGSGKVSPSISFGRVPPLTMLGETRYRFGDHFVGDCDNIAWVIGPAQIENTIIA